MLSLILFLAVPSHAWENHPTLMPAILGDLAGPAASALDRPIQAPRPEDDQRIYQQLAQDLLLNPHPATPFKATSSGGRTGRDLLTAFVNEPDWGMDHDLPAPSEKYDPKNVAKWMGGTTGYISLGARHMFFGGWQLRHPIATLQMPPYGIGYAAERAVWTAQKAREFLSKGGVEAAWGYRLLAWSIHYLQDLTVPFHAVQMPTLGMMPWSALLHWPPTRAFDHFLSESTRIVSNYHLTYEQYTLYRIAEYADCLKKAEPYPTGDPDRITEQVLSATVPLGAPTAVATEKFFGAGFREADVDIANGKGLLDYAKITQAPELAEARAELTRVTCQALGNASSAARAVIQWATAGSQ